MKFPTEHNISEKKFCDKYINKNQPVIVKDMKFMADNWQPESFKKAIGDLPVQVYDTLFDLKEISTLNQYIDNQFNHADEQRDNVPYIRWYNRLKDIEYAWSDEAFEKISQFWQCPSFLPKNNYIIPSIAANESVDPVTDLFPYRGILVAAKGARTRLHRDPFCTDAVVAMFHGIKEVSMYRPERAKELAKQTKHGTSFGGFIDVRGTDPYVLDVEPDFHGFAEPGDLIYIPHGWLHDVIVAEDSLSVTWNFIHEMGSLEFIDYLMDGPENDSEFEILKYFFSKGGHDFTSAKEILKKFDSKFLEIEVNYS